MENVSNEPTLRIERCEVARQQVTSLLNQATDLGLGQKSKLNLLAISEELFRNETQARRDQIRGAAEAGAETSETPVLASVPPAIEPIAPAEPAPVTPPAGPFLEDEPTPPAQETAAEKRARNLPPRSPVAPPPAEKAPPVDYTAPGTPVDPAQVDPFADDE